MDVIKVNLSKNRSQAHIGRCDIGLVCIGYWIAQKGWVDVIAFSLTAKNDNIINRADSRFAPSQWETALLCNDVSHWLGASLESALINTEINEKLPIVVDKNDMKLLVLLLPELISLF